MKREHLKIAAAGALVLVAALYVLGRGPETPQNGSSTEGATSGQTKSTRDSKASRPRVVRKVGATVSPDEFAQDFGELGFEMSAGRAQILEISAPGDVILGGDTLKTAPGGDGVQLYGNPSMITGTTLYRTRDGKGFIHIKADGSVVFGTGDWEALTDE